MAPTKRTRDEGDDSQKQQKKPRTGFRVGPDNLPDGAWKRKVTKIKKNLIQKAKIKKQFAKVKAQIDAEKEKNPTVNDPMLIAAREAEEEERRRQQAQQEKSQTPEPQTKHEHEHEPQPASPAIHPARQAMLDNLDSHQSPSKPSSTGAAKPFDGPNPNLDDPTHPDNQPRHSRQRNSRKHRPDYFSKELTAAQKAKEAAEKRAAEIARREAEKQEKIADRERFRRQMAKAKEPGRDGKRKVGKEGKLLLERVQRLVGEGR
ncbi:hypothetical protein QBC43DRAFT_324114 [Cladorrhinum sp. PSN259]|nr:hypothetical protein QBC43DRAFT_324114 [Cladorrhinum sp. PSN259]